MTPHDVLAFQIMAAQKTADAAQDGTTMKLQALFRLAAAHSAMAYHLIKEATALIDGPRNPID